MDKSHLARSHAKWWLSACLAATCASGCAEFRKAEVDPFMTDYRSAMTPPPADGVVPAQFQETYGDQPAAQGVSINDELIAKADREKSFADRVTEASEGISTKKTWLGMRKMVGQAPSEETARQSYAEGEALFNQKRYTEAARAFKSAAWRWPDSPLAEDALLMQAECYFFSDAYRKASDLYDELLKKDSNSRHLERITARQFAIGHYWEQIGRDRATLALNMFDKKIPIFDATGNAIGNYDSVRMRDPTGPLADDAIMATANAHLLRNHFEDAAYHYGLLRKEYPQSEFQAKAHLLGIQAQLAAYQGPQYDGAHLAEAETLVEQSLRQFPELESERARLLEDKERIRLQRALREWDAAEYYHKNKYYGAAAKYYQILVDDYADTPYGPMARDRLEATKDLPRVPRDRFAWLAKLFGEPEIR